MSVDIATLALRVNALEVDAAGKKLDAFTAAGGRAEKSAGMLTMAAKSLAAALAAVKMVQLIQDATMMAARYETLGVVMRVVGNNAGYTASQMYAHEKALQKNGIAMIESRDVLIKMASAQMDLTKATELSRVAQDAAVIGGINSSEAFTRIVNGIKSGEVEVLKSIGLNYSFEASYRKMEEQLGRNKGGLSEMEKTQARMNGALLAGRDIAGSYEAAMGTAGKMISSMQRYTDNLKVSLGAAFGPATTLLVDQMTDALKEANREVDSGQSKIQEWGNWFRSVLISVEAEIQRFSMLLDKVGGTLTTVVSLAGTLGRVDLDPTSAATTSMTDSSLTEWGNKWNKFYEDRYKAGDENLQRLADLELKLTNTVVSGSDQQEQARIAAGNARRVQTEADEKAARAAEEGEKASKAAAKASAEYYQQTLDRLLPLRKEQEDYNKALAVLDKMDPSRSTDDYREALKNLNATLTENIKLHEEAADQVKRLSDQIRQSAANREDINREMLSGAEQEIYDLQTAYKLREEQIAQIVKLDSSQAAWGETAHQTLGVKLVEDIEKVNAGASGMSRMFEDVAKNIQGAFSEMFEDLLNGTDDAMSSIGNMFKRLLAQMATMAIARPIIIPMVTTVGGAMGMSTASIAQAAGVQQSEISGMNMAGISSLFASGSLQEMGASGLVSAGAFAHNIGLEAVGGLAQDAGMWLNSLSSGLADGLVAGVGSLAMSLLTGEGLTIKSGATAGGAAIGAALAGPVGAVLGGLAGSILGGLFGDDDPNEYILTNVSQNVTSQFDAETGFSPTGWYQTGTGNMGWRNDIYKAYSSVVGQLQTNFNAQVFGLAEELPQSMADQMINDLAATDWAAIVKKGSAGNWYQTEAEEGMEEVAVAIAEGFAAQLGKSFGSALTTYLGANGAAGLVGDEEVWNVLTEYVQDSITDSFNRAADTISGGDVDGGISAINSVNSAISQIAAAMAPINEIIETDGLTDYEKSIRSINQAFEQRQDALEAAGVDLSKYPDFEKAWEISLRNAAEASTDFFDDIEDRFRSMLDKLDPQTDSSDSLEKMNSILTQARQGDFSNIEALDSLASDFASAGDGAYASKADYQRAIWGAYHLVEEIERLNEGRQSFAVGSPYVPYDMTANIHQGEIVMDSASSNVLRKYGIPSGNSNKELIAEIVKLRDEVASLRAEQRSANMQIGLYAKKTADLAVKADTIGAPPARTEL